MKSGLMLPGTHWLFSHRYMEAAADPAISSTSRARTMSRKGDIPHELHLLLFIRTFKLTPTFFLFWLQLHSHLLLLTPSYVRTWKADVWNSVPHSGRCHRRRVLTAGPQCLSTLKCLCNPACPGSYRFPPLHLKLSPCVMSGLIRTAIHSVGGDKLQRTEITRLQDIFHSMMQVNAVLKVMPWPPSPLESSSTVVLKLLLNLGKSYLDGEHAVFVLLSWVPVQPLQQCTPLGLYPVVIWGWKWRRNLKTNYADYSFCALVNQSISKI